MTDTLTRSSHDVRFPNESGEYRAARDALLDAELDLRRRIEAVAAQRRALPPGGLIAEDYVFQEGEPARAVRLSELFGDHSTLVVYNFMYGPNMKEACPSCTSILDSLERAARHIRRRVSLVVVARSPLPRILAFARERGWRDLRLLSSSDNKYNIDYFGETTAGDQRPILNTFRRQDDQIRHAYASELAFAPADPGQDPRHVDTIWPLWGLLDFTPDGRGADFRPKLSYD